MQHGGDLVAGRGWHFGRDLPQGLARYIFVTRADSSMQQQKRSQIRWWGGHAAETEP